jgi:perosamine synthetase
MRNGSDVARFERDFANYCGARYCIALANGTATLETALVALDVGPGDHVTVPPITHAATSIAVLRVGATPLYRDIDPETWLLRAEDMWATDCAKAIIPVSLYGLESGWYGPNVIDDAAQTLRMHNAKAAFTSWSFQGSKHLALGEGGMLATNDAGLAQRARWYSSLGYDLSAETSRIDPEKIKRPDYVRHIPLIPGVTPTNYRMSDHVAQAGIERLKLWDVILDNRREAARMYWDAIGDCDWIQTQREPAGARHDYWAFAFTTKTPALRDTLSDAIVRHGGERPYACWLPTYKEPAFAHLAPDGGCPIAESVQARMIQMQTNDRRSVIRNAQALKSAIREIDARHHTVSPADARENAHKPFGIPCS